MPTPTSPSRWTMDGSIEHVKMKAVSTETDFSYDFHDLMFTPVKAPKAKL